MHVWDVFADEAIIVTSVGVETPFVDALNVAEEPLAGMTTEAGTTRHAEFELNFTERPLFGARPVRVIEPDTPVPPVTLCKETETELTVASVTVTVHVLLTPA